MPENLIAEVLLDEQLGRPLDYEVPEPFRPLVCVGMRVEVPVRNRLKQGTISILKKESSWQLRQLHRLLPQTSLPEALWKLAEWMARYYCCSLQKTLKCLTPPHIRKEVQPKRSLRIHLALSRAETIKQCETLRARSSAQSSILDALLMIPRPPLFSSLMKELNLTRAPFDSLVKKKIIRLEAVAESLLLEEIEFFPTQPKSLNEEQKTCLEAIHLSMKENRFSTHLIYGITGSGKTEIYLQAIQQALDLGKSSLLLVPEIALTSQTIERFRARFGLQLAVLHHRRSLGERTKAWESLKNGTIKVAIGARSAIFAPALDLGLIIIDEEHDSSYKQSEESPTYHARDIAVMRAKFEKAVVLLGSATPSLESFTNAKSGKYCLHTLSARATKAPLPHVRIIDMKIAFDRAGGFTHFSQELLDAIQERLSKGEQTLLLLNRRGYHRMQICATCRYIIKCPHCDLSLTYHRAQEELRCHLCDYRGKMMRECPSCHSSASLEFRGFGTEHVERTLHAIFPQIRTLRMDRDTTRQKDSHESIFKQFRAMKADVLIGTQMIAKGFHFPSATLVGVLNADASLQIPEFRSAEKVFQLITQVAGRAGRAELPGEVILQTFLPDHPLLRLAAAQDYPAFYTKEIEERRLFSFPPFCRLIKVVISGPDEKQTQELGLSFHRALLEAAPQDVELLPLLPAPHTKIKDLYRFQFLLKAKEIRSLSEQIASLRSTFSLPRTVSLLIDVDPISTFF